MATKSIDLGLHGLHDVEAIGSGGTAVVYKAVRDASGPFAGQETVAVKVLRSSWDTDARRRFEREQQVMDRLSDAAGFVPILETGETGDGSPYIVMPFYEGGSLQERVSRSGPIEWPRAVRLVEEVAGTLRLAHELDVFHRDIKPANILLTESGRPHVADFGISLIVDDPAAKATSTAAFTPAYSPPESFTEGLMPVATTDIYGLAATLWAILAGHAPFKVPGEQPTAVTVFGRVRRHQVGDLREHVPSPICRFVERAMAKVPEDRPATMADFLSELEKAREDTYRGVEAPRVEIEPLDDPVSAGHDDADFDPDGEDGSTVMIGVLPAETDESFDSAPAVTPDATGELVAVPADAAGEGPETEESSDGAVSVVTPPAEPSKSSKREGGWLVKALAAAAATVLLLLSAWWISGAGSDDDEGSAVIVAEGESAADSGSSESGRQGRGGGGQSALDPATPTTDEEEAAGSDTTTAETPPPTAAARRSVSTRRTATRRATSVQTAPPTSRRSGALVTGDPADGAGRSTSGSTATSAPLFPSSSSSPLSGSVPSNSVPSSSLPFGTQTSTTAPLNSLPSNSLPSSTLPSNSLPSNSLPASTAPVSSASTSTSTSAPELSPAPPPDSRAIQIVSGPGVVSATGTSVVFSYRTNDVCGTGSFTYTEVDTGRSVGRWVGDRGCFGPVHRGETRWPGITLSPGTTYLVTITVEGQPSNGSLAAGTGQASTSFRVTTAG